MMRKLMVPVFAAVALVMVMSTVALAADIPAAPAYGSGQCVNFVDANGDGVCDNAGTQVAPRDGTGNQNGAANRVGGGQQAGTGTGVGQGGNGTFVDADSDGVCDNLGQKVPPRDGTGNQNGTGSGQRGGRS